jgi:hypothetical protein
MTIEKIDEQIKQLKEIIADKDFAKGTANTMTRVSGYYRAVELMHAGKGRRGEFGDRLEYEPL